MIRKFLPYYKPHMNIFIPDMAASLLVALIGLAYPIITRKMLNDFIPEKQYALIVVFGYIKHNAFVLAIQRIDCVLNGGWYGETDSLL